MASRAEQCLQGRTARSRRPRDVVEDQIELWRRCHVDQIPRRCHFRIRQPGHETRNPHVFRIPGRELLQITLERRSFRVLTVGSPRRQQRLDGVDLIEAEESRVDAENPDGLLQGRNGGVVVARGLVNCRERLQRIYERG